MTLDEALQNLRSDCPREIREMQTLIDIEHIDFEGNEKTGYLVMDKQLEADLRNVFSLALEIEFPIHSIIPISDERFNWDDDTSLIANNTSGFNYRPIVGKPGVLSNHARGQAIDINPVQNPYIKGDIVLPPEGVHDPEKPGTLFAGHRMVDRFRELGWNWGGEWTSPVDYQHFEKPLN